jgi:hypothetical protein
MVPSMIAFGDHLELSDKNPEADALGIADW